MSASEFAFIRGVRAGMRGIRRQARAHALAAVAIALVMVVLLGIFVAALPLSASSGPTSAVVAAPAVPSASHVAVAAFGSAHVSASDNCTGVISGGCIFQDIWGTLSLFFTPVISSLGNAFSTILGSFAGGIATVFQQWGQSFYGYGIWAPLMVVVSLGVAAFVGYYFMDLEGVEGDLGKLVGMAGGEGEEEPEVP